MSTETEDMDLVRKHVTSLGEHFDSVQIFVTRHEPAEKDGTVTINFGSGNWFARYGQVRNWVNVEEEASRIKVRKQDGD